MSRSFGRVHQSHTIVIRGSGFLGEAPRELVLLAHDQCSPCTGCFCGCTGIAVLLGPGLHVTMATRECAFPVVIGCKRTLLVLPLFISSAELGISSLFSQPWSALYSVKLASSLSHGNSFAKFPLLGEICLSHTVLRSASHGPGFCCVLMCSIN